jgi:SP family sugar:H+ symporter-like MFS transporter
VGSNYHEKPAALTPAQAISDWVQIMMGRFIAGWGVGALSAAVPVYQSETAPKEIRGTLVATYQLLITLGILVAYCFSIATRSANTDGANWRIVVALGWLWALILGVGILFMPESPRWLVAKGRYDEAKRAIARVKGCPIESDHVEYTFSEIATDVKKEEAEGVGTWFECLFGKKGIPKLAYRTYLLMVLQAIQQLTGANYFFY